MGEIKVNLENFDTTSLTVGDDILAIINQGKSAKVSITEWRDKRSLSQNALYFKWLAEIAKQTEKMIGQVHDVDTYHEHFKKKFCPLTSVTLGKTDIQIQSTKKLDKPAFHRYLEQIDVWAHSAGYVLTIPMESEYKQMNDRQCN